MANPTITYYQRRITVVEGIPYYCSTGENSGHSGVWFPFLMIVGTKKAEIPWHYDKTYHIGVLNKIFVSQEDIYIIKYSVNILRYPDITGLCNGRLPTLSSVKTSLALGSTLNTVKGFEEVERKMALTPITPIELSDHAPHYESPDEVNKWLVQQGAEFVSKVLTAEPRPLLDHGNMITHHQMMMEFKKMKLPGNESPIFPILKTIRDEVKIIFNAPTSSIIRKVQKEIALMDLYNVFWRIHKALAEGKPPPFTYGEYYLRWKEQESLFNKTKTNYHLFTEQIDADKARVFFSTNEPNSQKKLDHLEALLSELNVLAELSVQEKRSMDL
ncbi:hypothetical protein ACD661_15065 [Legionella lytica]|uniref:Uncharacterized protein n=1 Tax=Legionella lytica TaxID=96232 RepID=A0ABW8DD30_9GAMM